MRTRVVWSAILLMVVIGAWSSAPPVSAQLGTLIPTIESAAHLTFQPGDVLVSLEAGPVQWWLADGTPRAVLAPTVTGYGEGMAFDASGNLYVARWRSDTMGLTGNTVEKYNTMGLSMGAVGTGYDCDPHTIAFTSTGITYVGQAGCRKTLLKFLPGQTTPTEMHPAEDAQGIFWMDLAPDGCTLFYTSIGRNVKRFNVCSNQQLSNLNAAPLPGAFAHDLRMLPDGGVLVANANVITRLNAAGAVTRTYSGPPENTLWAGLDLVGDGTFWVANYFTSNVYRFDLTTGTIIDSFNTGTPANTAVGVRVVR
jgi:outer membrane protein assembly factor BamB